MTQAEIEERRRVRRREVWRLSEEGLPQKAIAQKLGCGRTTVTAMLRWARRLVSLGRPV